MSLDRLDRRSAVAGAGSLDYERFGVEAFSVRRLGFRDASDRAIFEAAREAQATVITKDSDFVLLQEQLGAPPKIVWVRCGNTSNARLREVFAEVLHNAFALLEGGERLVEITDLPRPGG